MEPEGPGAADVSPEPVTLGRDALGLGAGKAILITIAFYVIQVVVVVAVVLLGVAYFGISRGGLGESVVAETLSAVTLPAGLLGLVIAGAVAFGMASLVVRGATIREGLSALGFRRVDRRDLAVGLLVGVALAGLYLLLATRVHPFPPGQEMGPLANAAAGGGWRFGLWVVLALLAPPIEEFVFRGVLWSGLRQSWGRKAAGVVVTVLFVSSHVTELLTYWPAWFAITALALGTVHLRARSGSLVPPLALHWAYNSCIVLMAALGGI